VLESVARESLSGIGARHVLPALLCLCAAMHHSVEDRATKILAETKRFAAITPFQDCQLLPVFKIPVTRDKTGVVKIQPKRPQIAQMNKQIDCDIPAVERNRREVEGMFAG
jgi:hypothetical protein